MRNTNRFQPSDPADTELCFVAYHRHYYHAQVEDLVVDAEEWWVTSCPLYPPVDDRVLS